VSPPPRVESAAGTDAIAGLAGSLLVQPARPKGATDSRRAQAQAQPSGQRPLPAGMRILVEGSRHPELIPDERAIRMLMLRLASAPADARRAQLAAFLFNDADRAVLIGALTRLESRMIDLRRENPGRFTSVRREEPSSIERTALCTGWRLDLGSLSR
jgi:hypothetical protein